MAEKDDMELLARYARDNSEEVFTTLVDRHVNLVYSVAFRQVGNAHQAGEITQAVFIVLARKASSLSPRTVLSGWLYHTARLTAANFLRGEVRRQKREQEAYMQSTLTDEQTESVWRDLSPLLDEGMARLGSTDRDALVLRYFQNKSLKEVGRSLGVEERAAQKRVARSLERLRDFFSKRGLLFSAATIATAVSANSVQAAPIGLSATITATVVKGSMVAASTLTLVTGALKFMAWTKAKTVIGASLGVLLVAGLATMVLWPASPEKKALATTERMAEKHIAEPIDLTANYTTPASYFDQIQGFPAWKTVPRGIHVFDNIPLQIDGMICLWGEANATKHNLIFPEEILGIQVNQKFQTLYVYHGAFFDSPPGTPVCEVVFRYEDGSSVTNQMLYGDDILNWSAGAGRIIGPTSPNSKLAWVGGSMSPTHKQPLRLCLTAIQNPQSDLAVTSIDLYSCKSRTAACIMAMTAGKAGLMKDSFTDERNN